jgi:glycosyltransferase involved in cell wall biosynthesis
MGFQVGFQNVNFAPAKSLFYFPSDGGGGLPQYCEQILKHFNIPVAMAEFGQKQSKEYHNINSEYIPHAVDVDLFRPINDLEKSRLKQEFKVLSINGQLVQGLLSDKFVVGTVARNQGRKMLDKTIKAFYDFSINKDNAILLLHSDLYDASAVFDLRHLISRYNLENKVVFSPIRFFDNFEYHRHIVRNIFVVSPGIENKTSIVINGQSIKPTQGTIFQFLPHIENHEFINDIDEHFYFLGFDYWIMSKLEEARKRIDLAAIINDPERIYVNSQGYPVYGSLGTKCKYQSAH